MKAFLLLTLLSLAACQNTVRKGVYKAYETVGIQKRDLLKSRVDDARDEQKGAGETFGDALDRLRALYSVDGGNLEKQYDSMRSAYEKADSDAKDVRNSIKKVETVAGDLFKEWEQEAKDIETASLRARSLEVLRDTRRRYEELHAALKRSESRMEPVLVKFKDQVTFLKHNLNARAITSLKGEALSTQGDIEKLVKEMNASVAEADRFIAELK